MAKLEIDISQVNKVFGGLDKFRAGANRAGRATVKAMAHSMRRDIRNRYAAADGLQRAPGTMQKRTQGKNAGRSGAAGARPNGFGKTLMDLVAMRSRASGSRATHKVFLRPSVPMRGGATSEGVGLMNEFGEVHTMTADAAVRTYLRALAMGVAGTDTLVRPKNAAPLQMVIRIPARPVWQPAIQEMIARNPKHFAQVFGMTLKATTGINVEFK